MDSMSSVEFRKRYAKLTEVTTVTVNGHRIGTWRPVTAEYASGGPITPVEGLTFGVDSFKVRADPRRDAPPRTFTPAPKPGKR